jgi:hypothetical protein
MRRLFGKIVLNPYLYGITLLALGLVAGAVTGGIAHLLAATTMPWLTASQRGLILPCFLALGLVLGVFCILAEASRGNLKGKPK